MEKWKYCSLAVVGVILATSLTFLFTRKPHERVLDLVSPLVEVATASPFVLASTASAIPSASPSAVGASVEMVSATSSASLAIPSGVVTLKLSPTKVIPTPSPAASKEINEYIDRFSSQFGIDPNVLRYVAICESGFRSNATNGKYAGLFQFDTTTWSNIRKEIGENPDERLRLSAEEAVQTAAYAISKGKERLWPNCIPQ